MSAATNNPATQLAESSGGGNRPIQTGGAKHQPTNTGATSSVSSEARNNTENFCQFVRSLATGMNLSYSTSNHARGGSAAEIVQTKHILKVSLTLSQNFLLAELETPKAEHNVQLNKMMYEIILNWPSLRLHLLPTVVRSKDDPSAEKVFIGDQDVEFLVVLGAFLSLSAGFSTKVAQILDELIQALPDKKHPSLLQLYKQSAPVYKSTLLLLVYLAQKKYLSQVEGLVSFGFTSD